MSKAPKLELVNVETDASESFRLGIKLKATTDGLKVFATFRKSLPEANIIEEFIQSSGVKAPLNMEQFRDLSTVLEIMNRKTPVLVADLSGSTRSALDWAFTEHQAAVDAYWDRRQKEEGAIFPALFVKKGDHVATRQDAEKIASGLSYTDVFGKMRDGQSRLVKLKASKGLEEKDGEIIATATGYLVITGDLASVQDKMVIESAEEAAHEPITFLGSIEVSPKVTHAKGLMAANDITIKGNWKSGNLKADGLIRINGEVSGEEIIEIESKTGIVANFVNQCRMRCEADIQIETGVFFSVVRALGSLKVPKGAMVGGRFYGAQGVQALEAGDADGEATILSAGYSDRIADSIGAVIAEHSQVEKKLLEIQKTVRPYLENPDIQESLDDDAKDTLNQLLDAMKILKNQYIALGRHIEANYHGEYDGVSVKVDGKVHPGVTIIINNAELVISEMLQGAVFRFDPQSRKIIKG